MSNVKSKKRENWASRFGFIMATAGFAIGLGNIWRFPYMVGMNGGGAFLFLYFAICIVICIPLFISEISLGRKAQENPIMGMRKIEGKGSFWVSIGWTGTIAVFLIMTYYPMVIGSVISYFFKISFSQFDGASVEEIGLVYKNFMSNPTQLIAYTVLALGITGIIATKGIEKGIEKACKYMMPALFIMLIVLAIRSLTLENSIDGLRWYLTPDFSKINGSVALAALGQAFFSVGIGMASAFVYGSYLSPKTTDVPKDSILVVIFDTAVAFISGLVIFPALFAFGMSPDAGPGLLFITMPKLFSKIPFGNFFGGMFFFLITLAGITSALGFLEPVASTVEGIFKVSRKKAVWYSIGAMFLVGMGPILSQGPWSHIKILGRDLFGLVDFVSGNILLTLCALLISIYTAYVWKFEKFMEDTNIGSTNIKVSNSWRFIVKYIVPIAVGIIMITGIF
ncbi:sodium-dependent transporter [Anaeromicrobium sediminis]|uniref:Transporter n=1 Tax=Anaeromicrobium sediminis TaxID=1478221 RepID=A0A267MN77_9FIRM|nr:sodium-dependent transporter [Anaeromicrobium sediminis]PAB61054.1 sodium-dependent transporter [Anaeromicrobium sediminis]